ncbi:hypothetical protein C0989_000876 [Termitomyces sp. Mn162]|nr:hypothetical protein C0989_000876 [Termitomyces sp. Mn162]
MARIENLPSDIKNGQGLGATQVVGWLPVLSDDPAKHGKPDYVNFKKADQLWDLSKKWPRWTADDAKMLYEKSSMMKNKTEWEKLFKSKGLRCIELFVFASHNVLAIQKDSFGYKLLVAFRKYANMVMFETLEVHTSTTITAGHKAVEEFRIAINAYDKALSDLSDWLKVDFDSDSDPGSDDEDDPLMQKYNFPKLHNQTHAFGDVEDKEVLRGFSTQLFEGHHKSLKHWYQTKTKFKDIASQVRFTF